MEMEAKSLILSLDDVPIREVTFFLDHAEIRRHWLPKDKLDQGLHLLCLKNIPGSDADSFRISVQGFAKIKHVMIQSQDPEKEPSSELAQSISELAGLQKDEAQLTEDIQRLTKQREVWNQYLGNLGKHATPFDDATCTDLPRFLRTYDAESRKIERELQKLELKKKEFDTAISADIKKVEELSNYRDITVTISVEEPSDDILLSICYNVSCAKWFPKYDVKVFSLHCRMQIAYYGCITQKTGEDWKNVIVSFATAPPVNITTSVIADGLSLTTDHLSKPQNRTKRDIAHLFASETLNESSRCSISEFSTLLPKGSHSAHEKVEPRKEVENGPPFAIELGYPVDLPSNSEEPVSLEAVTFSLECSVVHFCKPNLSRTASVSVAGINTSSHVLFPGTANFYLDGVFIGMKKIVKTVGPLTPFHFWLGADAAVVMQLKAPQRLNFKTEPIDVKDEPESYRLNFDVDNGRKEPVNIVAVWDVAYTSNAITKSIIGLAVPAIITDTCKVTREGIFDEKLNQIEWQFQIPANEALTVGFTITTDSRTAPVSFPDFLFPSRLGANEIQKESEKNAETNDSESREGSPVSTTSARTNAGGRLRQLFSRVNNTATTFQHYE